MSIIELFSRFFQVTERPVSTWLTDRSLERNMNRLVEKHPNWDETQWVLYFIEAAQGNLEPMAVKHLCAYRSFITLAR